MNKKILNAVLGYESKESSNDRLEAGLHLVEITDCRVMNSRLTWKGAEKAELPGFADPTPQLGVEFRDESGAVAWHRFNFWGYQRWDELPEADQSSDKYEQVVFGETVYACEVQGDDLVRILDPKRTSDAQSIVDQFIASVGMTGEKIGEIIDTLIGQKLVIKIEDDEYLGKAQTRVASFDEERELVEEFGE
jgi:hypothetical protein